ncbi:MAG: UbiX family flavin prenyltransferase [Planctomycetes bacterium]|nr:UbiX family flavin prenyltransferase [Planctomycetota bacterium]
MRIVVGISGASGTVYGQRLVARLAQAGVEVFLTMSKTLEQLFPAELGLPCDVTAPDLARLFGEAAVERIRYRRPDFVAADVASGSFRVDGTVICPASTGLVGRVSVGASTNLLERVCDVALKERRPLVLVPRETPLSTIHLEALTRLSQAGATILPAAPGFYHRPQSVDDLVDFVVQKVMDRLGVPAELVRRWGGG